LDIDEKLYRVEIFDLGAKMKEPIYVTETMNTTEAIETLRSPRLRGTPFKGVFWWNPQEDIAYAAVGAEGSRISLSFLKPFVLRSRRGSEFLKALTLPKTADNLIQTRLGEPITLVAHPDLGLMKNPFSRAWKILFLQTKISGMMQQLQNIDMNIMEVAQFFECDQFVDVDTASRHPLVFTVNSLDKVTIPSDVFQYKKLATFLEERGIETPEVDEWGT
jgi:hypothetical protein